MGTVTNVILITGFLGSGKTTFLNRMVKKVPPDLKMMILMNEFGEVGLDGTLIEGDDYDMLEISRGSIFCVCVKTDFIKALNEVARTIRPDLLIVESTGVANPTALKKDLGLSIFNDRFRLADQVCIIDAACFEEVYDSYASVEKQIESSSLFVINKTDLVSTHQIAAIKALVNKHNASARFMETTFADIPIEPFFAGRNSDDAGPDGLSFLTNEELEAAIEELMENPDADAVPPDRLLSAVYLWQGKDINTFKAIIPKLPKKLIRAKGVLDHGEGPFLFNLVMAQHVVEPYQPVKDCTPLLNNVVFIGPPEVMTQLEAVSRQFPQLVKKSIFDPMQSC
jgi:G3E family GTPase